MTRTATPADVLSGAARWCVVTGDNDPVLRALADASVDVTITDPPYDERTHAGAKVRGGKLERETTVNFQSLPSAAVISELLRVSRRWVLAFCAMEQIGAYADVAGDSWIRTGIWHRPNAAPQFTGDRPAVAADAIAIAHRKGKKRWNGGGRHAFWSIGHAPDEEGDLRDHPTQKPLRLMQELVRLFSDDGDVVLDPYAGSGTTGVAALSLGRRAILVERDPAYAERARARCEAVSAGLPYRSHPAQGGLFR